MATPHRFADGPHSLACALLVGAGLLGLPSVRAEDRSSKPEAAARTPAAGATGGMELLVVNGQTGRPEPGVAIQAPNASGVTDERGRYRISWTGPRPPRLWFNVRKPGFVGLQVHWDNDGTPGGGALPSEYKIELDPGSEIGGVVQDEEGHPVAGASVAVQGNTSDPPKAGGPRIHASVSHQAMTDAAGRWKCGAVPDRINLSLRISHPDFVPEWIRGLSSSYRRKEFAELHAGNHATVLRRGATIAGEVRGADGQPVEGAEVSLSGIAERFLRGGERPPRTDAAGRFRLEHVAPGPNELIVRALGHVPATRSVVAGRETKPLAIRLEKGRSVSGSVVDHDGKPIPDAMVYFELGSNETPRAVAARADADGRFRLDGVPDDPGSLVVARQGTTNRVTRPLSRTESDVKVVLPTFNVIVRGTVTDAETGRPVPSFAVLMDGCHRGRRPSVDGRFRMEWVNWTWCKELHAAIEADGYAFTGWRTVPAPSGSGRREVTVDFQLKRAASVVCVVRASDGSPVADAEIGLSTSRTDGRFHLQFRINDAHLRPNTNTYAPMKTDPDGRFTLAPIEGSDWMVLAHPRGVAVVETGPIRERRASPADIALRPWGRVEGTLRVGNEPGAHERIALSYSEPGAAPVHFVSQDPETTTDDDGRFAFDRLLPGTWRLEARRSVLISAFAVNAGEVTRLAVGGTGRPVIGRLALPDDIKAISQLRVNAGLSRRTETPANPEIRTDDGGRRREEAARSGPRFLGFEPRPDGSFRVEDVPPGDYELYASYQEVVEDSGRREYRTAGMIRRPVAVPEIPGAKGHSEEPLDLGTVTVEPFLAVGQPAPDFRATALDGQPIRLSDFRGKHVLVVFWGPNQRGGLEESRAIRSLLKYRAFASGERLIILGIRLGSFTLEDAGTVAKGRGWDWLNAVEDVAPRDHPRAETADSLRMRYQLPSRPSVWLIGPGGEIVGRDLRGDAIKEAAAKVLRAR